MQRKLTIENMAKKSPKLWLNSKRPSFCTFSSDFGGESFVLTQPLLQLVRSGLRFHLIFWTTLSLGMRLEFPEFHPPIVNEILKSLDLGVESLRTLRVLCRLTVNYLS